MINSRFKIRKILKLIMQVFFYTILFFCLNVCINKDITRSIIKKTFFPITYNVYWFITIYIGMYILSPFINKLIKSISQKDFCILLLILLILFTIIPTVTSTDNYMGEIQWFIFMYMIGAYIQLYDIKKINKRHIKYYISIGSFILVLQSFMIIFRSKENYEFFWELYRIINMNYLIPFSISIFIFLFFKDLDIKNNNIVNVLGKSSFGIYLLHDNSFRESFWKKIFLTENFYYANSLILVIHIIASVFIIYLSGTIIELIRTQCIEKPIFKIKRFDKWFDKIDQMLNIE